MVNSYRTAVRVTDGGRIVIPGDVRRRLGMEVGTELVMTVEDDCVKLMNPKAARQKARQRVQKYIAKGTSLSKELIAERKAEARRE
jgi:AbrB family looped-hinge helix DNA binding protein